MKKFIKSFAVITLALSSFLCLGCASKKGELVEITDESFDPKIYLIASGPARLVKIDTPKDELLENFDAKAVKAASLALSIYSGRKPSDENSSAEPLASITFDLLKDYELLLNGYDIMSNEKALNISGAELDSKLCKNQYYYAKADVEITVKDGKTVTNTKTLFSNDTVYTPLAD